MTIHFRWNLFKDSVYFLLVQVSHSCEALFSFVVRKSLILVSHPFVTVRMSLEQCKQGLVDFFHWMGNIDLNFTKFSCSKIIKVKFLYFIKFRRGLCPNLRNINTFKKHESGVIPINEKSFIFGSKSTLCILNIVSWLISCFSILIHTQCNIDTCFQFNPNKLQWHEFQSECILSTNSSIEFLSEMERATCRASCSYCDKASYWS